MGWSYSLYIRRTYALKQTEITERGNENTASSGSKFLLERRDESVESEGQDSDKKFIEQYMVQR